MSSIEQKSQKGSKKFKGMKWLPVFIVLCIGLLCIYAVFAWDILPVGKAESEKKSAYATEVDGDAYYLKERCVLSKDIAIEKVTVTEGNLDMIIAAPMELDPLLPELTVVPYSDPDIVYFPGGYSIEDGKFKLSFMNKSEMNYNIAPFKDFKITIMGKDYDVSLVEQKIEVKGIEIGAKAIDNEGKLNVELSAAFEDKEMKLVGFGKPVHADVTDEIENLAKDGLINESMTNNKTEDILVIDERGAEYALTVPTDVKKFPVTKFEIAAPIGGKLIVKLPAIITLYDKVFGKLPLSIPTDGEQVIDKEIDFKVQKAVIKSIKRTSPTSAVIELQLNTKKEKNIDIRSIYLYSKEVKKISTQFTGDKALMTIEFDEKLDTFNLEIGYPYFVINGDWELEVK